MCAEDGQIWSAATCRCFRSDAQAIAATSRRTPKKATPTSICACPYESYGDSSCPKVLWTGYEVSSLEFDCLLVPRLGKDGKRFVILRAFVVDWRRAYHEGAKTRRIAEFLFICGYLSFRSCFWLRLGCAQLTRLREQDFPAPRPTLHPRLPPE